MPSSTFCPGRYDNMWGNNSGGGFCQPSSFDDLAAGAPMFNGCSPFNNGSYGGGYGTAFGMSPMNPETVKNGIEIQKNIANGQMAINNGYADQQLSLPVNAANLKTMLENDHLEEAKKIIQNAKKSGQINQLQAQYLQVNGNTLMEDIEKHSDTRVKRGSKVAGTAAAGAVTGAGIGAAIGFWGLGVCAVPGAVIGSLIGGAVGAIGGGIKQYAVDDQITKQDLLNTLVQQTD